MQHATETAQLHEHNTTVHNINNTQGGGRANKNWCVRDEGSALQVFRFTDAAKLAAAPS